MRNYLDRSISFTEYRDLVAKLSDEGQTTGPEQTESRIAFTKLNRQRMTRLEKTIELDEPVIHAAEAAKRDMIWLIITEAWCGDAAQNIPVIEKVANASRSIETRYLMRDENLELMDNHLENGARAIPRLIALDRQTLDVLGTWGSRPKVLKEYFSELKARGLEKAEIGELLQRWYNEDKGRSLQLEFAQLLEDWGGQKPFALQHRQPIYAVHHCGVERSEDKVRPYNCGAALH